MIKNINKCIECEINIDMLLYTIKNDTDTKSVCMNHAVQIDFMDDLSPSPHHKCIVCGNDGFSISSDDFKVDLCTNHIYALVDLRLEPEAYFKIKNDQGIFHTIHDDFYCEATGECLQPSYHRECLDIGKLVKPKAGKVKKLITINTFDSIEDAEVMTSIHNQLAGNKDYIDSNIILNDSSTRCDGTENEIRVYFFEECTNMPILKL